MTENEAIQMLIDWADKQVGTLEGPDNWNSYAESPDITRLYGWNVQGQPWCDVFVDAGFIASFGFEVGSAMTYQYAGCDGASCQASADYYKKAKAWYDKPQRGDQVFFIAGSGINHTGIVTGVSETGITTVEGNSSDMVARRSYSLGSPQIAGYGRPNWSLAGRDIIVPIPPVEKDEQTVTPAKPEFCYHSYKYNVKLHLLKEGDYGPLVKNVQVLLNAHDCNCGEADGVFGNSTKIAVMVFQRRNKLTVDGEVGGQTYSALLMN